MEHVCTNGPQFISQSDAERMLLSMLVPRKRFIDHRTSHRAPLFETYEAPFVRKKSPRRHCRNRHMRQLAAAISVMNRATRDTSGSTDLSVD